MRIAACQMPDLRDEFPRALAMVKEMALEFEARGADIIVFPECFLQGYFTDPLMVDKLAVDLKSGQFRNLLNELREIEVTIVVGLIEKSGGNWYNTAAVIRKGTLLSRYRKRSLLKGEKQVFQPGRDVPIFEVAGVKVGINICYDLCFEEPIQRLVAQGVEAVVCPCNNMMPTAKAEEWKCLHNVIRCKRAVEAGAWIVSADVTGYREDCISYGPTAAISPDGEVVDQVPLLTTGTLLVEI